MNAVTDPYLIFGEEQLANRGVTMQNSLNL